MIDRALAAPTADATEDAPQTRAVAGVLGSATVVLSVTEGGRAAIACVSGGGSATDALAAALVAYSFVMLPVAALLSLLLLPLLHRRALDFGARVSFAFTGENNGAPGGLFVCAVVLGADAACGALVGRRAGASYGANVGASVAVVAMLAVLVVLAPTSSLVVGRIKSLVRSRPRALQLLTMLASGPVLMTLATIAVSICAFTLLPRAFLPPLGTGLAALVFTTSPQVRSTLAHRLRGRASMVALLLVVLPWPAAPALLDSSSVATRNAVFYGAPLAAAAITGARGLLDRDSDGYSPILLGGDCDDRRSDINPGAIDLPGNGVDENCSGSDGHGYLPMREPGFAPPPALPSHGNVVVLLFDALRPDHLSASGYRRPTSPNLDAFRADATTFSHAYSPAPSTRFALSSLLLGHDMQSALYKTGEGNDIDIVPQPDTLASLLHAQGYETVGFSISFVLQHVRGLGVGFDRWDTPWPMSEWRENYPLMAKKSTDAAIAYLAQKPADPARPFFLFVHYACTHDPYSTDPRWNYGSEPVDRYDSALNHCDDEAGRLLRAMDARPDADRTHTFVVSDHGELFGEHGFENHSHSVFEPDVRVLLMMRARGLTPAKVVDSPVMLTDVYSTILSLAGVPANRSADSWNLLRYVTSPDASDARRPLYLFTETRSNGQFFNARGVVSEHMKLVSDRTAHTTALYDLSADPAEKRDLSLAAPKERARLADLLDAWSNARR